MKLYKNKYLIGVYNCKEYDDSIVCILDNAEEFAEFFDITENNARVILFKAFNKKTRNFKYEGRMCEIHFIEY